jgi:hypothetical protein
MPTIVIYKPGNCFPQQAEGSKVGFDRLLLRPGTNHLSDDQFSKLQAHPAFSGYVSRGALVVQQPKDEVEVIPLSDVPANLAEYNTREADEIIDNTHDVDILKRWLSNEPRSTTRNDLTRRIKDLGGDV